MNFRTAASQIRDLPRYRTIALTLAKYGYHDVLAALRLGYLVRLMGRARRHEGIPHLSRPVRLRMTFEELGPTFVKLGQILSLRSDVLPPSYTEELALLRSQARPVAFPLIEQQLVRQWRRPIGQVFKSFDAAPMAAASIAQVHRAELPDGAAVVVKVRRPGIDRTVQSDLDILRTWAAFAETHIPEMEVYRPTDLVLELERTMKRELDFRTECEAIRRAALLSAGDPTVHIPRIYPELCTGEVLVMEYLEGIDVSDVASLDRAGLDRRRVAQRGVNLMLRQVFIDGFFQGDPHPGNMLVLPGEVIAPLDYGMYGFLDRSTREQIADLILGLVLRDVNQVLRSLADLGVSGSPPDSRALRRDLAELIERYYDVTLDRLHLGTVFRELSDLIRHHRLRVPSDLMLLFRAVVTMEAVGRQLDPEFDLANQVRPFITELAQQRWKPARLAEDGLRAVRNLTEFTQLLPEVLTESLQRVRRGQFRLGIDLAHFDRMADLMVRTANIVGTSVVLAALILSASILAMAGTGPAVRGFSVAALVCSGLAAIVGAWLFFTIRQQR